MNETKHSPEPWRVEGEGRDAMIRAADAMIVAVRHRAPGAWNAAAMRRVVACVNACQGLSTEALEAGALARALEAAESLTSPRTSKDEEVAGWEIVLLRSRLHDLGGLP